MNERICSVSCLLSDQVCWQIYSTNNFYVQYVYHCAKYFFG